MAYLLEKTVGSRKEDQATWLLDYLKRLFPKGGHLKKVIEDFQPLDDFSTLSKSKRKTYRRSHYKIFHTIVEKMSGSNTMDVQKRFLSARFSAMHMPRQQIQQAPEEIIIQPCLFKHDSWANVLSMINSLQNNAPSIPYSSLNQFQKNRRKARHEALQRFIVIAAGSNKIEEQEKMLHDMLSKLNRKYDPFS